MYTLVQPATGAHMSLVKLLYPSRHMLVPYHTFYSQNSATLQGWSPLHLAALIAHTDMVTLLLSHGADVMDKSIGLGESALHMACQGAVRRNELQPRLTFLEAVLARWHAVLPQTAAAYPTIVNILVSHGADINARDSKVWFAAQHMV